MSYQHIQSQVTSALKHNFVLDSQSDSPVLQFHSLFFWETLNKWVDHIAHSKRPFVIALAGASGSGKSFIREALVQQLSQIAPVSSFTQDNYYRDFEADFPHLPLNRFYDEIDFDDPAHIRFKKLGQDLNRIKKSSIGDDDMLPKLRFGTPDAKPTIIEKGIDIEVTPFIVTEGIHAFYDPTILPLYDMKIFVDIDEKKRRERWLDRNIRENRGTTDNMWNTTVDCLNNFILPARPMADIVINNNAPQVDVVEFFDTLVKDLFHTSYTKQAVLVPDADLNRGIA